MICKSSERVNEVAARCLGDQGASARLGANTTLTIPRFAVVMKVGSPDMLQQICLKVLLRLLLA